MKKKQSKSGPSVPETNRGRDRVSFMISSSIGMKQPLQCRRSKSCNSESKLFAVGDQTMKFRSQKLHCGTLRLGSNQAFSCGETGIL
ncbi:hypothetical protein YC2023_010111 [Brassica napus]